MNSDLEAVNRRPGKAGYPLRNRSASSNSGEGSQTRPDPNRYKKYLSLRNRKILDRQNNNSAIDEQYSNHTASQRTLDSQVQDQSKPLQPILKSTSSRVQDLRYRGDGANLQQTESVESMPPPHQEQHGHMMHVDGRESRSREHSPLRVKSRESAGNQRSGKSSSPGDRQRSPIQVYKCAGVEEDAAVAHDGVVSQQRTQELVSRRESSFERSGRSRGGAMGPVSAIPHDPFKSATEMDGEEEDFHFDFDQDGNCSYVNTTMQSELTTPKDARNSAKRRTQVKTGNIQQLSTLSQKAETLKQKQASSIRAYADELKHCQLTKVEGETDRINETEDDEAGEDSSGYVIEYEQVLKDNSTRGTPKPMVDYREDVGQDTILEQTQEAIETDSSPDAYRLRRNQNSKRHLRQKNDSSPEQQQMQQQDSPQFRRNFTNESEQQRSHKSQHKKSQQHSSAKKTPKTSSGFVDQVTKVILSRKPGTKDSPLINDCSRMRDELNSDYDGGHQQSYNDLQEPILTFENRQPASTQRTKTTTRQDELHGGNQIHSSSGRSADTGDYRGEPDHQYDPGRRFKPYVPAVTQQRQHATEESQFIDQQMDHRLQSDTTSKLRASAGQEQDHHHHHHIFDQRMMDSEPRLDGLQYEATPTGSSDQQQQPRCHDLAESNRKIARGNQQLEQEFEKQSYGSQPPSGNLIVTCIIRQPMETVGVRQQLNASRSYRRGSAVDSSNPDQTTGNVLSTARTSKSGSGVAGSIRAGISSSVGPTLNRNGQNRSQTGLDVSKISAYSGNHRSASRPRNNSQDSRSNLSAGGTRRKKQQSKNAIATKNKQLPNSYRHPHILTTQQPSRFVLRSPPGLQAELFNILLKSELDIKHCQLAFDEHGVLSKQKGRKSMKVYDFDNCIGETKAHSLALGLEQHVKWITQPRLTQQSILPGGKDTTSGSGAPVPKNVIFLFGQSDALKTQLLNVMQPNSLINQCLKARDLRFLRVSTYHMNQEYLLAHKSFGSKQQMRREIGMELREAFRERDLNAKKVALKLSTYSKTVKAEDVKMASHLIIQLDDTVFVDLADIDNLKDTSMAKKISADFSIVTNAILSMSPYYKDHDFGRAEEDRLAPYMETNNFRSGSLSFKNQISRLVSKRSRVLLLCCVIQCSMAGTQAVDYCHKIRSYFHGVAAGQENSFDMTPTRRMQQHEGDVSMETDQNVNAFKQLGGLIQEVSKARLFIEKIFATKAKGEPLKRSRNQLKEMVACLRDDVSDLLNSLAANNTNYIHQLRKIREMLQHEIYYMREKVTAMRSVGRWNSIGGSSHKSGRHALCTLPKTMLHQHQSAEAKRGNSQNAAVTSKQQKRNDSSSNLHNFRPQSQTSFNSGNAGSRPQSGRINNTSQQKRSLQQPRRSSRIVKNTAQVVNKQPQQQKTSCSRMPLHQQQSSHAAYDQPITFASQQHRNQALEQQSSSHHKRRLLNEAAGGIQTPLSTSHNLGKSHETLPVLSNKEMVASSHKQVHHQNSATSLKNLPHNNRRQSGSKHSTSRNAKTREVSGPYQYPTSCENRGGVASTIKKQNTGGSNSRFSTQKFTSGHPPDQLANMDSNALTTGPDDFRKQTLTSLNQQYTILSASKSCYNASQAIQENVTNTNPLAATESLHQEIYSLKEQLKQAIEFSEEQVEKRKQAEQNCIKLTKELSRAETSVADLQDRIVAKDQTIRSLESQLDFHKSKLQQSHHSQHVSPSANEILNKEASELVSSQNDQELEVLKIEKAQTDQMNEEILGQISMLKEALGSFQEQERTNQKLLRKQTEKDAEMQELKSQVAALVQLKQRNPSPDAEFKKMKQQMSELQYSKEKYREEALQLKQEMRQQKYEQQQALVPERGSRERKRTTSSNKRVESQDREPLHMYSKLMGDHHQQQMSSSQQLVPQQDQVATPQSSMPQQKSLNTIKNMIRDFKEQRKGLMRTTSSREAIMQQSYGSRQVATKARAAQQQSKKTNLRSSRSRENDEREVNRPQLSVNQGAQSHAKTTGYAHLTSHFR